MVLAARSPVFAGMFRNDTKEAREGRITITDMSGEVCDLFLRYIYTGRSRNSRSRVQTCFDFLCFSIQDYL